MEDVHIIKDQCRAFLKEAVRIVDQNKDKFPVTRCYVTINENNRLRIVDSETKNWWQIPKDLLSPIFGSEKCQNFIRSIEQTKPFQDCLGKVLWIRERQIANGTEITSGVIIANWILVSYLQQTNLEIWNNKLFSEIWDDCLKVFNPEIKNIKYLLYSPLHAVVFPKKKIKLSENLEICKLDDLTIAELASRYPSLSGFPIDPYHKSWPQYYLVQKNIQFNKEYLKKNERHFFEEREPFQLTLSEELVILRCFLKENISITNYEFVEEGKFLVGGVKEVNELLWRAGVSEHLKINYPTLQDISNYIRRRQKYLSLSTNKIDFIITSMRRFAVAWENPFKGDLLADLVSALERLVVDDDKELSYKLRVRVSRFLSKNKVEETGVYKNLKLAYDYRSTIFHGGYFFDTKKEIDMRGYPNDAKVSKALKVSQEIDRLIPIMASYYRRMLNHLIDNQKSDYDWELNNL